MNRFEIARTPLSGTNLIEASAGTGKTYTIAALVLRLVVESHIPINQLLVVTFTEAATEELKGRIRSRLREAIAFLMGEADGDPVLQELANSENWPEKEVALRRLRAAVRDFDEAAIFTIHGFCNRMLSECAFESGALFDTELVQSQDDLFRELAADFWRNHFYGESPVFLEFMRTTGTTGPDSFLGRLGRYISHPDLHLLPEPEAPPGLADLETALAASFPAAAEAWPREGGAVIRLLTGAAEAGVLNKTSFKPEKMDGWKLEMDAGLGAAQLPLKLPASLTNFTRSKITRGTRKNQEPPEHPFFDLAETLKADYDALFDAMNRRLVQLRVEMLAWARGELETRKARRNVFSFDDLLANLRNALRDTEKTGGGAALAERIQGRYKAALIDEFQDTDPVQYEIFHTLFGGPEQVLFLIGDPKQAIYGFRGADIFAYMGAKAQAGADSTYTLGHNWRSAPSLIAAVNTVFQSRDRAFIYPEIPFEPVAPAPIADRERLSLPEMDGAPLQLWQLRTDPSKKLKKLSIGDAQSLLTQATAAEISRLLEAAGRGAAVLDAPSKEDSEGRRQRPLAPGDIAVLVRKNHQAKTIQEALAKLGIPAVLHGTGDIFESHEAAELSRVMAAAAAPRNERRIRSALASDMMGVDGAKLEALRNEEAEWEMWLNRFDEWSRKWRKGGFIRMFRALIRDGEVLPRLMGLPDGERRCTNLLHLSELVHHAGASGGLDMNGLVQWLEEQRTNPQRREDEHPLRLESDADAVKLVTIHKSKGLEYPVVFCPFTWEKSEPKEPILFHGEERRLFIDLGSGEKDTHKIQAGRETLAENLRLLYVALTRARHRCYFAWGNLNQTGSSAPAWLFHGQAVDADAEDLLSPLKKHFNALSDETLAQELEAAVSGAADAIAVGEVPAVEGLPYSIHLEGNNGLSCLKFSRGIRQDFRIASFSGLVRDPSASADRIETGDRDFAPEPPRPVPAAEHTIFTFPRGARAGTCLHAMLEKIDFAGDDRGAIAETVGANLRRFAYGPEWVEPLTDMVDRVREVPIGPLGEPEGERFSLSSVPGKDCLVEMDFFFPLGALTPEKLADALRPAAGGAVPADFPDRVSKLSFGAVKGFMRGFIDLVFRHNGRWYLLDWKSNHLGDSVADYGPEALQREMASHFYILQYHIYAVALDQYLRTRLKGYDYEKHFGGVAYVFLRGVDGEEGGGVFWDRPGVAVMEGLREALIG